MALADLLGIPALTQTYIFGHPGPLTFLRFVWLIVFVCAVSETISGPDRTEARPPTFLDVR